MAYLRKQQRAKCFAEDATLLVSVPSNLMQVKFTNKWHFQTRMEIWNNIIEFNKFHWFTVLRATSPSKTYLKVSYIHTTRLLNLI
jgi:hypothetical protein